VEEEMSDKKDRPPRQEIASGLIGELSPVKVDHQMATTLPSLFAVGDVSYGDSAWTGAVPFPLGLIRGSGLMHAIFSSRKGGPAAAPEVDYAQAKKLKENMFAPLNRSTDTEAIDLVHSVQEQGASGRSFGHGYGH
jgi:hypothetical protein